MIDPERTSLICYWDKEKQTWVCCSVVSTHEAFGKTEAEAKMRYAELLIQKRKNRKFLGPVDHSNREFKGFYMSLPAEKCLRKMTKIYNHTMSQVLELLIFEKMRELGFEDLKRDSELSGESTQIDGSGSEIKLTHYL